MENVFNNKKLMERFFRPVPDAVWDLMTGKIGVKGTDGIYTCEVKEDGTAQVSLNLFDQFGMAIPAFAQSTPAEAVNVGDLIYGSRGLLGWVVSKKEKSYELMKPEGTKSHWTPPKVSLLGFDSGVMVLKSLISMLPGGSTGIQNMQGMLLPLMMMGGDTMDLGGMLPLILMSQMGGVSTDPAAPNINANAFSQMLPMMVMMQMMKGKGTLPGGSKTGGGGFFD
jgi:hypothetical protein